MLPSVVTTKKPQRDQVTPYKVALLVLIEEYCSMLAQKSNNELSPEEIMTEGEERQFMIALLSLVQGEDHSLEDFRSKVSSSLKQALIDKLLTRLKSLYEEGVHLMMDLFQQLPEELFSEQPKLHKTSVLGLYVRRMVLAFNKLPFDQVTYLHKKYTYFYETWLGRENQGASPNASAVGMVGDSSELMDIMGDEDLTTRATNNLPRMEDGVILETGKYSQRQAELFIAQQAALLQYNENQALPPQRLQGKLNELLRSNPALAEAHYLSYLNYLRIKEYCGAIQSLYHYFDRQQMTGPPAGGKSKQEEDNLPRGFRYAALNLAALQFRLGHRSEALEAVEEAIHLAQEANDHICLQHALGWLQRLGVQTPGNATKLLDRLVNKAGELNLAYLTSLGVQAFARHNALIAAKPSSVFDFLVKSDIVNCQHAQSDLMCVSFAQKAALWELYGKREMCSLSAQCMLYLSTVEHGVHHSGEAECMALCHLANLHAQQGDFGTASEIFQSAESRFPVNSPHANIWLLCQQQMVFHQALLHRKFDLAEKAVTSLSAVSTLEGSYSRCVLLKEQGEILPGLQLSQSLLEMCQGQQETHLELPEVCARLLMLQGELHCCSRNPEKASKPLLACLVLCGQRHFSYMAALATMHLAHVQFYLGMQHQALALIKQCLVTILSHGCVYDCARAHYLYARCTVAAAAKKSPTNKQQVLLSAVEIVSGVVESFKKVQAFFRVKDATYFLARLHHELGYIDERNKCSQEFRELDELYPTLHGSHVCAF